MDAENINNDGCSQRDSAEHKGYVRAHRSFNRIWKERDSAQPVRWGFYDLTNAYQSVHVNY